MLEMVSEWQMTSSVSYIFELCKCRKLELFMVFDCLLVLLCVFQNHMKPVENVTHRQRNKD